MSRLRAVLRFRVSLCQASVFWGFVTCLALTAAPGHAADGVEARASEFEQLLQEGGLAHELPPGFEPVATQANPVFPYEHAIRHAGGTLEVRYAIRPLGRLRVEYDDPHSAAPEPDHIFPMMFQALSERLATHGARTIRRDYSAADAKRLFNADWAAASVFDVTPDFSTRYPEALLLALHKNGRADAYAIFLYQHSEQTKSLIRSALPALTFR